MPRLSELAERQAAEKRAAAAAAAAAAVLEAAAAAEANGGLEPGSTRKVTIRRSLADGAFGIVTDLEVDTFYGVFQRTLISDCGGKGEWVFEFGVGLIQVETEGLVLDLVAPY